MEQDIDWAITRLKFGKSPSLDALTAGFIRVLEIV